MVTKIKIQRENKDKQSHITIYQKTKQNKTPHMHYLPKIYTTSNFHMWKIVCSVEEANQKGR